MTPSRKAAKHGDPTQAATLAAQVQARFEAEKAHVARHLHREVVGMLAAARMELSRVAHAPDAGGDVREHVARVDQILLAVIQGAQSEMQRLYPALLDHFGLAAALRHLVGEVCQASASEYTLEMPDIGNKAVPAAAALAAYRAVELLLLGQAPERVCLRLRESTSSLLLGIQVDHAAPLPVDAEQALSAIRAWLEATGGVWKGSECGATTRVELELPRHATPAGPTMPER